MRILFFSHYFPPEGNAPATRTHENCKRWVAAGHDVTVVTCAPNAPAGVVYEGYTNRLYQREVMDGIDVRRVWTFLAPNKGFLRRTLNFISYMVSALLFTLFRKRPDVTIATSPQFFCGWAGVLYSKLRRTPFILEIRDIWPESILAVGAMKKSVAIRVLEWLELRMYAAASHIVTVGDGYRRKLLEKGVPDSRISVVMNGVDRELYTPRPPDDTLKEHWGVAGRFVCGYVGTIGMACGLDTVLDAAQLLKARGVDDFVFMLVGDGAVKEELEDKAKSLKLDNVVFTGRQPKSQMPDYLSLMDVCLVCLRKSNLFTTVMPSKIFEAAAMRKPIINSVAGFASDFIQKANAGVCIEPENPAQLVDAVLLLKNNPKMRAEYGASGMEYVVANYNREELAAKYLGIIENTANP